MQKTKAYFGMEYYLSEGQWFWTVVFGYL